jgi:hypothetical protein
VLDPPKNEKIPGGRPNTSWTNTWLSFVGATILSCQSQDHCIEPSDVWSNPGAGSFCVTGDLIIEGRTDADLTILTQLESLDGSLLIHNNPDLVEFVSMPLLTNISGNLAISENPSLTNVGGFPALDNISGEIYVAENPSLVRFHLNDNVKSLGSLFFGLNPQLARCTGLQGVANVDRNVLFIGNVSLESIEFLAMKEVVGDLSIVDNEALERLEIPALRSIGGTIEISENLLLTQIELSYLEEAHEIRICGNDALIDLSLVGMPRIRELLVCDNATLGRITVGSALPEQPAIVEIRGNQSLELVEGFGGIDSLQHLIIEDNSTLPVFPSFSHLTTVYGQLRIINNPTLTSTPGWFPSLREANDIWIFDNASLTPTQIQDLLDRIIHQEPARVGDNLGENTALDPCPWPNDHICDAETSTPSMGTRLCLEDPEDCNG